MTKQIAKMKLERYNFDLSRARILRKERSVYNSWTSAYGAITRQIKGLGLLSNAEIKKLRLIVEGGQ